MMDADNKTKRVDVFNIKVEKFGWGVLVDINTVENAKTSLLAEALNSFVLDGLIYTDIGYAYTWSHKSAESSKSVAGYVPILRHGGRDFFSRNFIVDAICVTKGTDVTSEDLGYGIALGFGGKIGLFKGGIYWVNKSRHKYFLGISIREIASFIGLMQKL